MKTVKFYKPTTTTILLFVLIIINLINFNNGQDDIKSMKGLKIQGNRIVNEDDKEVFLRGVNRPGTEYSCVKFKKIFDGPHDANSIADMKNWNINSVRVPLNEDCWLGTNGQDSEYFGDAYRKAVIEWVDLLCRHNLAVIIDLHWTGSRGGKSLAKKQERMPNKLNSPRFWTSVANAFKDNTGVIFDVFNEPDPDENREFYASDSIWECWRDGVNCPPEVDFEPAGMQELVDSVRSSGAQNIILVGGVAYASSLTKFAKYAPTDPLNNLGISLHSYDFNTCRSRGCWEKYLKPLLETYVIVATETGEKDCKSDYIRDFLRYCDQNTIHYLAWSWVTAQCDEGPSLITNYQGAPTGFGRGYREHLLSIANGQEPFYSDTFDIFNDRLSYRFEDWSPKGLPHSFNDTSVVHQHGKLSIYYEPLANKQLFFRCWSCIDPSIHKTIEFNLNGGPQGGQKFSVELVTLDEKGDSKAAQTYSLQDLLGSGEDTLPADSWTQFKINLETLPQNIVYDGLWLLPTDADQPPFYIDKITVRAIYDPPIPEAYLTEESAASFNSIPFISNVIMVTIVLLSLIL